MTSSLLVAPPTVPSTLHSAITSSVSAAFHCALLKIMRRLSSLPFPTIRIRGSCQLYDTFYMRHEVVSLTKEKKTLYLSTFKPVSNDPGSTALTTYSDYSDKIPLKNFRFKSAQCVKKFYSAPHTCVKSLYLSRHIALITICSLNQDLLICCATMRLNHILVIAYPASKISPLRISRTMKQKINKPRLLWLAAGTYIPQS